MPEYRRSLVISFFFKFYLAVLSQFGEATLPTELISATHPFKRCVVKSSQGFQSVPSQQLPDDTIGRPMMHLSALQQATGEARYIMFRWKAVPSQHAMLCILHVHVYVYAHSMHVRRYTDDIPHIDGELYAGLVMSTRPHANITVDYSEAVKMEGVAAYVGAPDVPGSNFIGKYSIEPLCYGLP